MPIYLTRLAEFVSEIRFGDLADDAVRAAQDVALDTMGAVVAGMREPECARMDEPYSSHGRELLSWAVLCFPIVSGFPALFFAHRFWDGYGGRRDFGSQAALHNESAG